MILGTLTVLFAVLAACACSRPSSEEIQLDPRFKVSYPFGSFIDPVRAGERPLGSKEAGMVLERRQVDEPSIRRKKKKKKKKRT